MREASPIIDELAGRLKGVRNRIADAARAAGRHPDGIRLIAVSKTVPADVLRAAHGLGQDLFGESYVQEALAKIDALADLPGIVWHFIGPIQSNKTRPIPEPTEDPALQRARFSTVRSLLEAHRSRYPTLDTLSMGMSDDLESAIAEGATLVRIGRAVFGERV